MKTKVIAEKNLPVRMPLQFSLICYLLLDKFHAEGWVWGVVGTILALYWFAYIYGLATQEYVDLFEKKNK
jgi:hypothetical protein